MNCDFMARPSGLRAKKMLKLFIKRGKKAALLQTQEKVEKMKYNPSLKRRTLHREIKK